MHLNLLSKLIFFLIFVCIISVARGQILTPIKDETKLFTKAKVTKEFGKMLDNIVFPHLPASSYTKKHGTWAVGNGYPVLQLDCDEESDSIISIKCIVWNDFTNTDNAVCFVKNGYLCAFSNKFRQEWIKCKSTIFQFIPYRSTALVELLTTIDCPDFELEVKYNTLSNFAYLEKISDRTNYGKSQFYKHNVKGKKVFRFEDMDNVEDIRKCCNEFKESDIEKYDFHMRSNVFASTYLRMEFICETDGTIKSPDMIHIHERTCAPCLTEKDKDAFKAFLMEKQNWIPGVSSGKTKRTLYSMSLNLRFINGKTYYDSIRYD